MAWGKFLLIAVVAAGVVWASNNVAVVKNVIG
jgi:hypothetical protein